MSIRLNDILSQFTGFVKPSLYEIEMIAPEAIQDPTITNLVKFNCHTATVPGINYGSFDIRQGDWISQKRPNDKIYAPVKMVFYNIIVNDRPILHDFFQSWIELIHGSDKDGNYTGFEFYENYVGVIKVHQMDEAGKTINTHTYTDFYPLSVSGQELSYSTTDSVTSFAVEGTYK